MTKQKRFQVQKITNDHVPEDAPFPRIISEKRHGICVVPKFGEKEILGRSLKKIKNIQFQEHFKLVLDYCNENKILLQAEAHINGAVSDDMVSFLNTIDLNENSKARIKSLETRKKKGKLVFPIEKYLSFPIEMKLYVFDCLEYDEKGWRIDKTFLERYNKILEVCDKLPQYLMPIPQAVIETQEEEDELYNEVISKDGEGLVIRYDKPYKMGRTTPKELIAYKRVPEPEFDGMIIRVNQATEVDPNAEKTKDEMGYSKTSKKKDDRIYIEQAKDFQVQMKNEKTGEIMDFGVSMKGFDHEERKKVWMNKEKYVGRWLKFESKDYKWKGVPKSAKFIDWREDLDGTDVMEK